MKNPAKNTVKKIATSRLPTKYGEFTAHVYQSDEELEENVALVAGDVSGKQDVLVRVHSECLTGDIFSSSRCDCGEQLEMAQAMIAAAGEGVVLYLRGHEGRGIGLVNKIHAYELQDRGLDTVEANIELGLPVDTRSYDVAAEILLDLGLTSIRILTNNPRKIASLEQLGLKVTERVPLEVKPNRENTRYLQTKRDKLGHLPLETINLPL